MAKSRRKARELVAPRAHPHYVAALPRQARPEKETRSLIWIALALSDFERDVIDELYRRGGFARFDDVVLAGLWQLARQLDVHVPVTTFGKRGC